MHDQRGIDDEEPDIGPFGALKPAERCDVFAFNQEKALAVIETDQAFVELDQPFRYSAFIIFQVLNSGRPGEPRSRSVALV